VSTTSVVASVRPSPEEGRSNSPVHIGATGRSRFARCLVGLAVPMLTWLGGASVFFFAQWSTGFDRLMGNTGDSRLIVYLNEQWFLVLHGAQPWRNPPIFYPAKGVLGYTDTFFMWQIFFAPLRAIGADPFLAFQLTIVLLSLLAFITFVMFLRMAFQTPLLLASAAAFVVTFSNSLSQHDGSPQLFGVYFVPPIMLIGLTAWRSRLDRPILATFLAAGAGFSLALLLFSTYYVAWFSLFSAALILAVWLVFSFRAIRGILRSAWKTAWRVIVMSCIGFAAGLVPFLVTYLPVVRQLGVRRYADAMFYAAKWNDVVNVSTGNFMWGHVFDRLWSGPSPASYEDSFALPPILLGTIAIGITVLLGSNWNRRSRVSSRRRLTLALCIASIVLSLAPIETSHGSLWAIIWHLPGADAIRAIDRIEVVNNIVASIAVVLLLGDALNWTRQQRGRSWLQTAGVLLLCALAAEELHDSSASQWSRTAQIRLLDSVPAPPAGCTSFFVTDSRPNTWLFYEFQTESMLVSQRLGIPTLNGYSGDNPPGWNMELPESPGYLSAVSDWAHMRGVITGVCDLDFGTMTWTPEPSL